MRGSKNSKSPKILDKAEKRFAFHKSSLKCRSLDSLSSGGSGSKSGDRYGNQLQSLVNSSIGLLECKLAPHRNVPKRPISVC